MQLGIKQKITISSILLIFATASIIVLLSYQKSKKELSAAVDAQNFSIATFEMKNSMEEMSVGAKKINETGLSTVSSRGQEAIIAIGSQVDQFKV